MYPFKEPYFLVEFNSSIVNFEIYINDMPAFTHHSGGAIFSQVPINQFIVESGKQNIKIKIFPLKGNDVFKEDAFIKIKVFCYDSFTNNYESILERFTYETPDFTGKTIPYFETVSNFDVEVPYRLLGWIGSVEFKDIIDSNKIIEFYKNIYTFFNNENISELMKSQVQKFNEIDTALYLSEDNNRELSNLILKLKKEQFVLRQFPISTKIQYFGYGKVLSLVDENNLPIIYYRNEDTNEDFSFPILIHKKDVSGSFEIIR